LTAIETRDLTRYYGDLCAVDHLDLTVGEGELFGFLGPNGAGKTTTIRMLTGLIRPDQGTARVQGFDIKDDPLAVKARVGVVPQRSNLYGELSARENLIFAAKLYGLPRDRRGDRADELLADFELSARAQTPFRALSGGMKRRLTIAAALVHEPEVLFLDEPTTGLDVHAARALRGIITDLKAQGVTIFLTTHLIHEAEILADRVAIIVRGRLIAVDTPDALQARVQDESVLEVELSTVDDGLLTALRGAAGVRHLSRIDGERLRLVVDAPDVALRGVLAVLDELDEHYARLEAVQSITPSLEDAFVALTDLDVTAMGAGGGAD
jgi:ABC-2 type transport system ATP-binding protein